MVRTIRIPNLAFKPDRGEHCTNAMADETIRKIIHIDMDAFFASVEQRDNPALRGLPVAVGGSGPRGVVAAASYEARRYGVRSAMPSATALRLCPNLIFTRLRFDAYRAVSSQIRAIFLEYTPLVQPLSLDEAYLDVTANQRGLPSATATALEIRGRIREETGLTASAGISYNKFLAKLASDQNKPDGQCVIRPEQGAAFVAALPVERFHGIGPRTAEKLVRLGIRTGADLRAWERDALIARFGKAGNWFHAISRGEDNRRVDPDQPRKSVGSETTFERDLMRLSEVTGALDELSMQVWRWCERRSVAGRTVTIKVRFTDFRTITRSRTEARAIATLEQVNMMVHALAAAIFPIDYGIRLLGVTISNIIGADEPPPIVSQLAFEL